MAGLYGVATSIENALAAATVKTVLQLIVPANHRVKVLGWGVFFDGVNTAGEPVQVRVLRQTTAGVSLVAASIVKTVPCTETLQTTATMGAVGAQTEPTAGDVLDVIECHPQQGYEVKFPMGQELIIGNSAGITYLGIDCTAPAIVNVRAKFFFEE